MGLSVEVVRKPPKPATEKIMPALEKEWRGGRGGGLAEAHAAARYVRLPRMWVVERAFSWVCQNSRMSLWTTRGYAPARKR
jgi:hypothetical protein